MSSMSNNIDKVPLAVKLVGDHVAKTMVVLGPDLVPTKLQLWLV